MPKITEQQLTSYLIEHQGSFYRLAYGQLQNRDDALDTVQTAVCKAIEKRGQLKDASALRAWFYQILLNTCADLLRQRSRTTTLPAPELLDDSSEVPLPEDMDLAQRVDALPPETATVIRLRFYEELSLQEISLVTGTNINTVKTRLYTGLKKLRISMEGDFTL